MSLICLRCSGENDGLSPAAARVLTDCFSPASIRHETVAEKEDAVSLTRQHNSSPEKLRHTVSISPSQLDAMTSLKQQATRDREESPCDMDLTYITERMIALSFPSTGHEAVYRKSLQDVARMLKDKHGDNYQIVNLSEKRAEIQKFNEHVLDLGWPANLAPPLERLCSICKSIDSWFNIDSRNVVVLHCKAGLGRLGVVIASFIHYSGICASEEQALDRFAMKKYYEDKLAVHIQPSQKRYVYYFDGLLSGVIIVVPHALFLYHLSVTGIPMLGERADNRLFFKIYQAMKPVYTSGIYTVSSALDRISVGLEPSLQLQGDILVKCYHRRPAGVDSLFRCQFHTSTIPDLVLHFSRSQLDDCCADTRFTEGTRLDLHFSRQSQVVSASPHVPSAPVDFSGTLERWDSYEDFNTFSTVTTIEDSLADSAIQSRIRLLHVKDKISPVARTGGGAYNTHASRVQDRAASRGRSSSPSVRFTSSSSSPATVLYSEETTASSTSYLKTVESHTEQFTNQRTPTLSKYTSSTRVNFSESTDSTSPHSYSSSSGVFSNSSVSREGDSSDCISPAKVPQPTMATTKSSVSNSFHSQANGELNPLDQIINELLQDDLYPISNPYRAKKSTKGSNVPVANDYKLPPSGVVTTQVGNTTTVLSWDSSQTVSNTMSSRSSTMAQSKRNRSPNAPLQRSATLGDEYARVGEPVTVEIPVKRSATVDHPSHNLSETTTTTLKSKSSLQSASPYTVNNPTATPVPPPRTHPVGTSAYKTNYTDLTSNKSTADTHNNVRVEQTFSRGYFSDSEEPMSWLEQQRLKLDSKRHGPRIQKRTEQEKQLVDELKSSMRRRMGGGSGAESDSEAMTSWTERRSEIKRNAPTYNAMSDTEDSIFATTVERNTLSRRNDPKVMLKGNRSQSVPESDDEDTRSLYRTEKRYYVSGLERNPAQAQQTKYTFSLSTGSDGEPVSPKSVSSLSNKPPASPGQVVKNGPNLPLRTSSKDAVTTVKMQYQEHRSQGRGHTRHHSDSGVGSKYATLPSRLRSLTPSGRDMPQPPSYESAVNDVDAPITTSRGGYFTFGRRKNDAVSAYATLPRGRKYTRYNAEDKQQSQSNSREESHSFLKEYVANKLKDFPQGYGSKADDLEKSIQDLLNVSSVSPPIRTQGYEPVRTQGYEPVVESRVQQHHAVNNLTSNRPRMDDQQPVDIEEDVISLQPIGRGVLNLEPEGTGAKTPIHFFTADNMAQEAAFPITQTIGRGGTMSHQVVKETEVTSQTLRQDRSPNYRPGMSSPMSALNSSQLANGQIGYPRSSLSTNASLLSPPSSSGGGAASPNGSNGLHSPAISVSSSEGAYHQSAATGVKQNSTGSFNDMLNALQQKHASEAPRSRQAKHGHVDEVAKTIHSVTDDGGLVHANQTVRPSTASYGSVHINKTTHSPADNGLVHANYTAHSPANSSSVHANQTQRSPADSGSVHVNQATRSPADSGSVHVNQATRSPADNGSVHVNRVGAVDWPGEVTSTMVRKTGNLNFNGLLSALEQKYGSDTYESNTGHFDESSAEKQNGPLLQNGLDSTKHVSSSNAANFNQLLEALEEKHASNNSSSQQTLQNHVNRPQEAVISAQRGSTQQSAASKHTTTGNGKVAVLQNDDTMNDTIRRLENQLIDTRPVNSSGSCSLPFAGSAPSSGGRTAANQLSPHHNYTTEQISPTYSHDNHSVPQPQRVTPNFPVSPIPPAALQGNFDQRQQTVRQTSDYTNSQRTPNSAERTPPVFTPNSADGMSAQFNGSLKQSSDDFVQYKVLKGVSQNPANQNPTLHQPQYINQSNGLPNTSQLTIDTSLRPWDHQGYSPSSGGSGQSPALPAFSGTMQSSRGTMSRQGMVSPGQTIGRDRQDSFSSVMDGNPEILPQTPKFVHDTSRLWYKPKITREEAIALLKDRPAGSFIIRDSNTFEGSFGLAVKVSQLPPNIQTKGGSGDPQAELVRHFLIEPTAKGVKIKGCSNEPTFTSLAALVYQHSVLPMALPCKLLLPSTGPSVTEIIENVVDGKTLNSSPNSVAELLAQGVACNVLFINSVDMECLTGPQAVSKALAETLAMKIPPKSTIVHFKVSSQGITVTDNKRKLFFRRHYPVNTVTFCGLDPELRTWQHSSEEKEVPLNAKIFGLIARKQASATENTCHLFAELDPAQPASAIVNFITKVMMGQGRIMKV